MPRTLPLLLAVTTLYAPEALAQDTLAAGASFQVKDVSSADGDYAQRGNLVGVTCTAAGPMTRVAGTSWFGGPASCNGATYYFFQVEPQLQAAAGFGSAGAPGTLPAGTAFVIADISPDDAYYGSHAGMVGISCTVASANLTRTDGKWFGGDANCDNGSYYYFYKMSFTLGDR